MSPPAGDELASTGLPDRQTLRLLERILADEPVVATTEFKPDSYEPNLLRALCDTGRSPVGAGADGSCRGQHAVGAGTESVRGGPSRAAVSRGLAEKVEKGKSMIDATLEQMDEVKAEPGSIVDLADVPEVDTGEVDVEGEIIELWEPSKPSIQQVGLIADETEKIKFTIWKNSYQTKVSEGDTVRFRNVKKNWHNDRCNLSVTGWSRIHFPKRGRW